MLQEGQKIPQDEAAGIWVLLNPLGPAQSLLHHVGLPPPPHPLPMADTWLETTGPCGSLSLPQGCSVGSGIEEPGGGGQTFCAVSGQHWEDPASILFLTKCVQPWREVSEPSYAC